VHNYQNQNSQGCMLWKISQRQSLRTRLDQQMNQTVLTQGVYNMQWLYSKVAAATSNSSIVQQQHRSTTASFNSNIQQQPSATVNSSIFSVTAFSTSKKQQQLFCNSI